ncbi:MAG: hypothetical protein JXB88_21500 [Spirochaetales bacterium]|nr:hypothetical protein [Spirochaetales bacterium]
MKDGIIQKTINVFQKVFHDLHANISLSAIERLAVIIHNAMGGSARNFHTLEHVFNIMDPSDPLHCLAALFHDTVYYQVDRGFTPAIQCILSSYIQEKEGEVFITKTIPSDDRLILMTLDIFGFTAGQKLSPFGGLNEFLSALVMNKISGGIITEKACVQITVCIEATIPFRGRNKQGESWAAALEQRLIRCNEHYNLSMTSGEVETAMKRAVMFANSDVGNFAEHDVGKFLDNTWRLLLESNSVLYSGEVYFIRDYRRALQKMEGFFCNLNPDNVFTRYRGVPSEKEFQNMQKLVHRNIHVARQYLGIKLLAIAIIEALAEMTGGDAPLALFMGDIRKEGDDVKRLEDFLPIHAANSTDNASSVVVLLNYGRPGETSFDMSSSPLAFFLYKNMEPAKITQFLHDAKDMFAGNIDAREFINKIDKPVVSAIARASAEMVVTRREELLQYAMTDK